MKQLWFLVLFIPALEVASIPQILPAKDAPTPLSSRVRSDMVPQSQPASSALLEVAEQDAYRLEGPMRVWGLWQVARVYQATDKKKALRLLDAALAEAATMKDMPAPKIQEELTRAMNGGSAKSTRAWLQEQAARTVVMVSPSRADDLLPTLDAANRGPILQALMSYYERHKMTDRAIEQFYRIAAEDEAPYAAAVRIMATLRPEQSGELAGMFSVCLASYRGHAPHNYPAVDEFPRMVTTYWRKVPKPLAIEAVDEVIRQAQDSDANLSSSFSFDNGSGSVGSLLQYRLVQLMPALQELEGFRAKEYLEKFPSVGGLADKYAASTRTSPMPTDNQSGSQPRFRVTGDSGNLFLAMNEKSLAQKITSKADTGHADEAVADSANIVNPDLRVQALEYIARTTIKKDPAVAESALGKMLTEVEKGKLDRQADYYASATGIFLMMGDLDAAKDAIEKGLSSAAQLYQQDTDGDDPNTAFEAFWPSTNAYCTLLREARRISEPWAVKLLKEIDNPEIRFAAETAIAGGALDVPESRTTIIISKHKSFRMSLGANSPDGSSD